MGIDEEDLQIEFDNFWQRLGESTRIYTYVNGNQEIDEGKRIKGHAITKKIAKFIYDSGYKDGYETGLYTNL